MADLEPPVAESADTCEPVLPVDSGPQPIAEPSLKPQVKPSVQTRVRRYPIAEPERRTDVSRDDADVGWSERPREESDRDDWYRRERPPHHGG